MTGARARALHDIGIRTPWLLATAAEEDVVRALTAALPRNMRASTADTKKESKWVGPFYCALSTIAVLTRMDSQVSNCCGDSCRVQHMPAAQQL